MLALGTVATVASLLIVLVIAAPSLHFSGGDSADGGAGGGGSVTTSAEKAPPMPTTSPGNLSRDSRAAVAPAAKEDRDVKTTTSLTLTTTPDQVQSVSDRAIRVVDSLGGYVASSEIDSAGSRASATLSLKIPAGKVDDGLARLSKLAHVAARSQQTEDLTDTRALLEAQVRDARADREGLRARLAKAGTDKERSRLRALLDRATRRVTARERAVASLGQEVAYGDVELEIQGRKKSAAVVTKPGDRWTPADALGDAGRVLEVIAGVLMIALAILFPLAVIGVIGVLISRVLTRHRRLRALEMA
jgi:hypothetical protein